MYRSERGDIDILLTGDTMVSRRLSVFDEERYLGLVEAVRQADVSITNCEMLFHDYEPPASLLPGGTYMRAAPEVAGDLKWFGFDMAATANNHAFDFGAEGLLGTIDVLNRHGLVPAGSGADMAAAREPQYLDTAAGRVGLVAVTFSGTYAGYAGHRSRNAPGRPGANMIRYHTNLTVDGELFDALRRLKLAMAEDQAPQTSSAGLFYGETTPIEDSADAFYLPSMSNHYQYPYPNGCLIRRGGEFSRQFEAEPVDLQENLRSISDARRMADWVVVSVHSHENGSTPDEPSAMLIDFAHAAVDAGANVVFGHGPHRDRGIEIYNDCPIFYSLGNFIYQNDTVTRVPAEALLRSRLDPVESVAADYYDLRSGDERDHHYEGANCKPFAWRGAVAVVEMRDWRMRAVRLIPIDLGYRRPRGQRGRPMLADQEQADAVADNYRRLCAPFGVDIDQEPGQLWVRARQ